jgi:hypothetical protein
MLAETSTELHAFRPEVRRCSANNVLCTLLAQRSSTGTQRIGFTAVAEVVRYSFE